MSKPSIRVFKPFTIDGCTDKSNHHVQEIIYYGESRARHMVAKIIKADAQHRAWMQAALQEEVVRLSIHKMLFTYLHFRKAHRHVFRWHSNSHRPDFQHPYCPAFPRYVLVFQLRS